MKKSFFFCSIALLLFCFRPVLTRAQEAAADKPTTVSGEIVDMDCYMAMGMSGASHKDCSTKCIASGQPMGLLTSDGKVYVLMADQKHGDTYNDLKKHASEKVTVTGTIYTHAGVASLEVESMKTGG